MYGRGERRFVSRVEARGENGPKAEQDDEGDPEHEETDDSR